MFIVIITAVPATFSLFADYSYNGSRASGRQVEHDGWRELAPHNASDVLPTKVKPFAPTTPAPRLYTSPWFEMVFTAKHKIQGTWIQIHLPYT